MHLFNQTLLGGMLLSLLGTLVVVKRLSTGTVFDRPKGSLLIQFVNGFNLFFLLVVNPLAAVLLITHQWGSVDPTRLSLQVPWLLTTVEIFGLLLSVIGYVLMAWALISLGPSYQLGGSVPRPQDTMVMHGPYRLIRHPMYAAALSIALGLAGLTQSGVLLGVFGAYLALIILLIPREEAGLLRAYDAYARSYRPTVKRLIPFVY